jgi:hypothetical protein
MATELTPKQILDMVLDKSSFDDQEAFRKKYAEYLVEGFDTNTFFYGPVTGSFGHSHVIIQGKIAKSIVYDDARIPYLAYFIKEASGWKLHSINWWCQACNGSGMVFNGSGSYIPNLCAVCGGNGWGDLGDFELCIAETGEIEIEV